MAINIKFDEEIQKDDLISTYRGLCFIFNSQSRIDRFKEQYPNEYYKITWEVYKYGFDRRVMTSYPEMRFNSLSFPSARPKAKNGEIDEVDAENTKYTAEWLLNVLKDIINKYGQKI